MLGRGRNIALTVYVVTASSLLDPPSTSRGRALLGHLFDLSHTTLGALGRRMVVVVLAAGITFMPRQPMIEAALETARHACHLLDLDPVLDNHWMDLA